MKRLPLSLLCLLAVLPVYAEITMAIDKLDPSDFEALPPSNLVVVDVAVTLSDSDAFQTLGIRAIPDNGARLEYLHDPNGVAIPTAPGIEHRFVTFFSRPRPRDDDSRYRAGASVATIGGYTQAPSPLFVENELNAVLLVPPPYQQLGMDGWVARVVLDLSDVIDPHFRMDSANIVIATSPPPSSIRLLDVSRNDLAPGMVVYSTSNDHADINFGIYGLIPEPTTAVGLLVIAGVLLRRR